MTSRTRVTGRLRGMKLLCAAIAVVPFALGMHACSAPDAEGVSEPELRKKVLLIGLDGVRPDVLADVATPHIDALIEQGAFSARALTGYPSVSGPGWSSMLIGVWPDKHGVVNNEFENERYDEYPDFLTRVETLRPELNTFAVADWLPIVTDDHNGPILGEDLDVKHVLDGYELGWAEADDRSVELAGGHLGSGEPDAMFVYLGNPDETSHHFQSIGEEYRNAIALSDEHVGRLMAAVRARPTYAQEDWLILMSTDHGRTADGDHGGDTPEERTIFYLASGPSTVVGTLEGTPAIVDVPVTALAHLGIDIDPAWSLDGKVVGLAR